jgi:CTP synthase
LRVCVIGEFDEANPAHTELEPAMRRAAAAADLEILWIAPVDVAESGVLKTLGDADGVVGAPGPVTNVAGYLEAIEFAREGEAPYLGIETGMDLAVVEFARTVLVMPNAHSLEFDEHVTGAVVTPIEPPPVAPGKRPVLTGDLVVKFTKDGRFSDYYGAPTSIETCRTSYGVPPATRNMLFREGLKTAAVDETGFVVRALELVDHAFFALTSYAPHLSPQKNGVHPLLRAFFDAV